MGLTMRPGCPGLFSGPLISHYRVSENPQMPSEHKKLAF
ncbi:uncharacterized protein Dmul_30790 [Desulfococcus multivorans]|nr:uncharacterized protein Dmul_30790 [Desulfococcus multivorans]